MIDETTRTSPKDSKAPGDRSAAEIAAREVSDALSEPFVSPSAAAAKEAIDRATAVVGEDEG